MKRKFPNEKVKRRIGRRTRVVRGLGTSMKPRLTVYRSARHIYAQLDDPESGRTIASASTRSKALAAGPTGNVEAAKKVGQAIAELAKQNQIDQVVFNRNGFLYHGRVKALADAAREAGLRF